MGFKTILVAEVVGAISAWPLCVLSRPRTVGFAQTTPSSASSGGLAVDAAGGEVESAKRHEPQQGVTMLYATKRKLAARAKALGEAPMAVLSPH